MAEAQHAPNHTIDPIANFRGYKAIVSVRKGKKDKDAVIKAIRLKMKTLLSDSLKK